MAYPLGTLKIRHPPTIVILAPADELFVAENTADCTES